MPEQFDIYTTTSISVPHLVEVLARVRDEKLQRPVTVVHSTKNGEGDWILATAAARLSRYNVRVTGPETARAKDLVEHAIRMSTQVVFIGEIRREDDAKAARSAAAMNIHPVAFVSGEARKDAEALLTLLGPWKGFDLVLLSNKA